MLHGCRALGLSVLLASSASAGVTISTNDPQPGNNVPITWTVTTTDGTQIASIHILGGKPPPGIVGQPQGPDGWVFVGNAAPNNGTNATFDWQTTNNQNAASPANGWQFTITFDQFVGSAPSDLIQYDTINNGVRTFVDIPKPGSPNRGNYGYIPLPEPGAALLGLSALTMLMRRRQAFSSGVGSSRRNRDKFGG